VMATNMTRVTDVDPTDPEALTQAEMEGRRQAVEYARFLVEQVPGYENARMGGLSTQIGVRESRRIFGEYRLKRQDVLAARKFDDAIAQCGAPIEEHHAGQDTRWEYLPEGETYHIPYRCLLPKFVEGLLVAGRCLSADHDAHASVRSMGQCMAMGQAAGTAAALALKAGCPLRSVPISSLQDALRNLGAII
jgi:FAD dependent oxidoreductase